jgi:hypothetical protein
MIYSMELQISYLLYSCFLIRGVHGSRYDDRRSQIAALNIISGCSGIRELAILIISFKATYSFFSIALVFAVKGGFNAKSLTESARYFNDKADRHGSLLHKSLPKTYIKAFYQIFS